MLISTKKSSYANLLWFINTLWYVKKEKRKKLFEIQRNNQLGFQFTFERRLAMSSVIINSDTTKQ